jgi:hypothetical protein
VTLPTVTVKFGGTDRTSSIMSATIRHGRSDPANLPEASTLSLALLGPLPAGVKIGTTVSLVAHLAGVDYPRFSGRVTDLGLAWDDPDTPVPQLIAAGALSDMGRVVIGDTPWPAELDGARANRVIGLAGVPTDAARTDPGQVTVLARDVDAQPALDVANDAAIAGSGLVWQARDGAVLYADGEHRRNLLVSLELVAADLPVTLGFRQSYNGLVNDVRVRWGATTPQSEWRATNSASMALYGTIGASLSTILASALDAGALARYMISRQSVPAWVFESISMPLEWLDDIDPTLGAKLLALDMHALINVTGLPAGAPWTSALQWIEGWTETITAAPNGGVGSYRLEFAVSDYCRTAGTLRWDDVDPAYTWDTVDPSMTWDSTACLPPQPSRGRWADVSASLRWDQVAPAVTWDTWTG